MSLPSCNHKCRYLSRDLGLDVSREASSDERTIVLSRSRNIIRQIENMWIASSVTRLGDFLHFGQQFKAFGNNKFAQISYILSQFL